jgi:hypothetical protein
MGSNCTADRCRKKSGGSGCLDVNDIVTTGAPQQYLNGRQIPWQDFNDPFGSVLINMQIEEKMSKEATIRANGVAVDRYYLPKLQT